MKRARVLAAVAIALPAALPAQAQRSGVTLSGLAGYAGSALVVQGVQEQGSGLWYGGRVELRFGPVVGEASGVRGKVAPPSGTAGFSRDGGEIRAIAGIQVQPWLAIEGSYAMRAFDSPTGYQRWTTTGVGARLSSQLGTPGLRGYVRASYLLGVSVTGESSGKALGFEAGFRVSPPRSPVALGAFYRLESFDFSAASSGRREYFDFLAVHVGVSLPRRPR